ncbi:hypothetical protein [Chamaesiphon sp. VAR_48_metabat_403]|uniref:hypothetical protein n=1 Tax=Chamaesiphon sp. VAR_48_metabat_403 TaxID=2964700 RepID=UPI00286E6018|nr:hypothetical protein [Chamaesiphon sp. VAR_48_metabat_403]
MVLFALIIDDHHQRFNSRAVRVGEACRRQSVCLSKEATPTTDRLNGKIVIYCNSPIGDRD